MWHYEYFRRAKTLISIREASLKIWTGFKILPKSTRLSADTASTASFAQPRNMTLYRYGNRLTHASALEHLTLSALQERDYKQAFRYIDRRCRIAPSALAYHLVLRAEILNLSGQKAAALASLRRALEMSPDDLQANRRMLRWGDSLEQLKAAKILCEHDLEPNVLIEAASTLKQSGVSLAGAVNVLDNEISGWAAWDGKESPLLFTTIKADDALLRLQPDKDHALLESGFAKAASFSYPWSKGESSQAIFLETADGTRITKRILSGRTPVAPSLTRKSKTQKTALTVIVPVYRDIEATKACLDSLAREIAAFGNCRAVVVNDASPEKGMAAMLSRFAKKTGADLLTNERNLGFVGAVNRALATVTGGDVLLLNADALLSKHALKRLAKTARNDPKIGTITPLSNNGEYMSFPISLRANAMPNVRELDRLDEMAARLNKGLAVDVPSGIGFCLFITEACFQAVGGLTDCFHNGYFEDVDLCLRAREKGFRNVCDASVFVAHAGSRSFLSDKRDLVVRNLPIIEERFPNHQRECVVFVQQDPLRMARAAIEREACTGSAVDVLMVTGTGVAVRRAAAARAEKLVAEGQSVWMLERRDGQLALRNAVKEMPQSLRFDLAPEDPDGFAAFMHRLKLGRIEIADAGNVSPMLLSWLQAFKKPIDIYLTDATWVLSSGRHCLTAARHMLAADEAAQIFMKTRGLDKPILSVADEKPLSQRKVSRSKKRLACGVIGLPVTSAETNFMKDLSLAILKRAPHGDLILFGETLDDLDLLTVETLFVAGNIQDDDLDDLCQLYGIRKLFAATRGPFFGDPLLSSARATGLPLAYFDWADGQGRKNKSDLRLDCHASVPAVANALVDWMDW